MTLSLPLRLVSPILSLKSLSFIFMSVYGIESSLDAQNPGPSTKSKPLEKTVGHIFIFLEIPLKKVEPSKRISNGFRDRPGDLIDFSNHLVQPTGRLHERSEEHTS